MFQNQNQTEDIFEKIESTPSSETIQIEGQTIKTGRPEIRFKKKVSFKKIIIVLIVLVILAGIGFGFKFVWPKIRPKIFIKETESTELETMPGISDPAVTTTNAALESESRSSVKEREIQEYDFDHDGLTDVEEKKIGTDKKKIDSDNDGLSDKEEVKIYLTDPLNADTDADGISDGDEIKKFTDPKNSTPGAKLFDLQKEIDKLSH